MATPIVTGYTYVPVVKGHMSSPSPKAARNNTALAAPTSHQTATESRRVSLARARRANHADSPAATTPAATAITGRRAAPRCRATATRAPASVAALIRR